jgi:hypothetical protein
VEDQAIIKAGLDVFEEVGDRLGGFFGVELEDDGAGAGLEFDQRVAGGGDQAWEASARATKSFFMVCPGGGTGRAGLRQAKPS